MRFFKLIIVVLCFLSAFSCRSHQAAGVKEIVLEYQLDKLPQLTSGYSVKVTTLQEDGSRESLLSGITRLCVEEDRFFVLSPEGVSIFDGEGKFVSRLRQGRGPDEFVFPRAIAADPEEKTLDVLSAIDFTIYRYDYFGHFIND